jgi:FkbM family methyltransferase
LLPDRPSFDAMSVAPIRDLYRTFVPPLVHDVIRQMVIRPAQVAQEHLERELGRRFPEATEPHIQAVLRRFLRAGDTFVDVGANLGGLALAAARIVGVGGRIVCFEPVPANFVRLTGTLARQIPVDTHLILEERAVGAESGQIDIFLNFWDGLHTTEPGVNQGGQTGKIRVEQVTLDEALAYHRIQAVDMLKIDVEGAELRVLTGARQLLAANRISSVILEMCNPEEPGKADNARLITEFLADLGYVGHLVTPAGLSDWDFRACRTRQDVLFLRRDLEATVRA